ncbi:MAG TPA: hypothetical protein VFQ35_12105, partial [Polyangiaceae bacterium]|nr:hypothetical protein [Polyangiaceae bacterium]
KAAFRPPSRRTRTSLDVALPRHFNRTRAPHLASPELAAVHGPRSTSHGPSFFPLNVERVGEEMLGALALSLGVLALNQAPIARGERVQRMSCRTA